MELRGANISSRSYIAVMCCQKQHITRERTIPLRTEHDPESLSTVCVQVYVWLGSLLGVFRRSSQRPTCYLYDEYWSDLWSHAGRWLAGLQGPFRVALTCNSSCTSGFIFMRVGVLSHWSL
ncbi:hypothetical protein BDR06DRAFT_498287 [Suillus hirtellus]|nr:hypothetical protein BDR06DRAFT_498287 [Suillus hirtellus]